MDAPWFEPFRFVALTLIYLMFVIQCFSVHFIYRLFKRWSDEEAARRERWAQDMSVITRLTEEAYHQRAQAEVALAQARRHIPNGNGGG